MWLVRYRAAPSRKDVSAGFVLKDEATDYMDIVVDTHPGLYFIELTRLKIPRWKPKLASHFR